MTLTSSHSLKGPTYFIDSGAEGETEVDAENNGYAWELEEAVGFSELSEFTYSATAESATGTTAGDDGFEFDGQPGLIYSGPSGVQFRVTMNGFDIEETDDESPDENDYYACALAVNNEIVALADEGWINELNTETAVEFNIENGLSVNLDESDVIRVVLLAGSSNEAEQDLDISEGGKLGIIGS